MKTKVTAIEDISVMITVKKGETVLLDREIAQSLINSNLVKPFKQNKTNKNGNYNTTG